MTTARPPARTPPSTPRPTRVKVLVLLHGDGYIEVYAEPHVDVHIVQRLDTIRDCEVLADEHLDATLPLRFRELYFPRHLRAVGNVRAVTAEQELQRRADLEVLAALRQLGESVQFVAAEAVP